MKKRKTNKRSKFLVKENDDICVVTDKYFKSISRPDAVGVGVQTYLELQRQMTRDALSNTVEVFETVPIADGLEKSLIALEKRFPFLMREICLTDRRIAGQRVYKS